METGVKTCPIGGNVECEGQACAWWVSEYRWKKAVKEGEKDIKQDTSGCAVLKIAEKLRGWKVSSL